ncbi:MAG: hypothetical protein K6A72_04740 [Lachnospiraceae bacterium]|nr:hypothetical protein [Lachnospiraceae bacterium]
MGAEILIKTENILEAREAIVSLKQQNDELRARVGKLKSSLEWQVGAKEGINDNLAAIEGYLEKQSSFLENASNLCNSVVSSTEETSNALIAAISALVLSIIGISSVVTSIIINANNWVHNITSPDGNITTTITNTGTDSTDSSIVPIVGPNPSAGTKGYVNSSVNYKGKDYSNYNVVGAYDASQVLNQKDPQWVQQFKFLGDDGKYHNGGCVVSSEAMVYNMKHPDSPISPTQCGKNGGPSCTNDYSNEMPGSAKASVDGKRDMIYDSIMNGEPCMVRTTAYGGGHTVVAVGIKDGAVKGSLTNDDILIIDPADGKVKTIKDMGGDVKSGTKLWTAK